MSSTGATGNPVFAPAIFFIAFREALEASLVIGILTASLESFVRETTTTTTTTAKDSAAATSPSTTDVASAGEKGPADSGVTPSGGAGDASSSDSDDNSATASAIASGADAGAGAEHLERGEGALLPSDRLAARRALIHQLRRMVFLGAFCGLFIAFVLGAAFLAVFYTQVNDLYGKAEELWEGIFNLIAVVLIVPMSLAILRSSQAKKKWSRKLEKAFEKAFEKQQGRTQAVDAQQEDSKGAAIECEQKNSAADPATESEEGGAAAAVQQVAELPASSSSSEPSKKNTRSALGFGTHKINAWRSRPAWIVFSIPLITTLREGLEGVVFIGGIGLGLPATSIPLPAIVGLAVGFGVGILIWRGGAVFSKHVHLFLLFATCALMIIAAGMATRAVFYLQFYQYVQLVGDAAAESGDGAGSYDPAQTIAHFNCCNPETDSGGSGWGILSSLFGWLNTWTYGSVLMYIFFWLAISTYLLFAMWREKRLALEFTLRGKQYRIWESKRRRLRREAREARENRV